MSVETESGLEKSREEGIDDTVAALPSTADAIVLKFGSSVLGGTSDLKDIVSEIYRYARHGQKVVAVVSAVAGETDALIAEAAALGARASSPHGAEIDRPWRRTLSGVARDRV